VLTPLLAATRHVPPTAGICDLHRAASMLYRSQGDVVEAVSAAQLAVEIARSLDNPGLLMRAQWDVASQLTGLGRFPEALASHEALIAPLDAAGDLWALVYALIWIADARLHMGNLGTCDVPLERACELAARLDRPRPLMLAHIALAEWAYYVGDWARAWRVLTIADALCHGERDELRKTYWETWVRTQLGVLALAEVGETGEMSGDPRLEEVMAGVLASSGTSPEVAALLQAGQAPLAERDLLLRNAPAAYARLSPLCEGLNAHPRCLSFLRPLLGWAAIEQGDTERGAALLAQSFEHAQADQDRLALVDIFRLQGIAAMTTARWDEADRVLIKAIRMAHDMGYPYAEAKACYIHGLLYGLPLCRGEGVLHPWPSAHANGRARAGTRAARAGAGDHLQAGGAAVPFPNRARPR
jgi:hypothetical protein